MVVAEVKKGEILPGTTDSLTNPVQPPAQEDHPVGLCRKRFILFWWAASVLVFAFLVLSSLLNSLKILNLGPGGCFLSIRDYQTIYLHYPITNLLGILPLIILSTLGAVLQWQVLRKEVPVSGWWIAAPVLAGLPLLFGLPPGLQCTDIGNFAIPFISLESYAEATTAWMVGYFLLLGFIQWLVLRRKLSYSFGWSFIPLLGAFAPGFLFPVLMYIGLQGMGILEIFVLILPFIIVMVPLVLIVGTSFSLVAGYYLYRLILARRKRLLPDCGGGDEILAS